MHSAPSRASSSRTSSSRTQPVSGAADAGPASNLVVLRGHVLADPTVRRLGDGTISVSFDLVTVTADGRLTVPVVIDGTVDGSFQLDMIATGVDVLVAGVVRRRFFRAGGVTVSRTEVVAGVVERIGGRGPGVRTVRRVAAVAERSLGPSGVATLRSVLGALEGAP